MWRISQDFQIAALNSLEFQITYCKQVYEQKPTQINLKQ